SPGAGNLISGNGTSGITVVSATPPGQAVIQGNRIGISAAGAPLGNRATGITLSGSDTLVGGTTAGAGNLIANNGGDGISFGGSDSGARIQGNEIRNNAKEGVSVSSPTNAPPKLIGGRN